MRMWTRALLVGAIGLGSSGAVGCAEERAPINRVQPNALAKSFFVGEDLIKTTDDPQFWVQNTVVDVGYGAAQDGLFTSTYAQPVTRIKWEITEDLLIGRITYQRIDYSESEGAGGAADIDGTVAYAFPIRSHFDIRRDYNPSTGEESNVIVENASDRPWYERKYFRVDWSRNLNVDAYDFDTLSLLGIYGGIRYEPLAYYVNDPNHPDAPHFATDQGYFDITNKAFATPGLVDLSHLGWGIDSFPACYLPNDLFGGSAPFGNCNPVELTLRLSFRRVEFKDFEPSDHDGYKFMVAGSFNVQREGYARNYGMLDTFTRRYVTKYNLWERSHAYLPASGGNCPSGWTEAPEYPGECMKTCFTPETTPQGFSAERDDDRNGTHDECEDVTDRLRSVVASEDRDKTSGSRCDYHMQRCTLPYRLRKEVPVVWHFSQTSNPDFYDGTEWAAHEWDVALRVAVQAARYSECVRTTPGDNPVEIAAACQAAHPIYTGQQEDNQDAVALAREVDDCRAGLTNPSGIEGAPYSEARVNACNALADSIGGTREYQPGVIGIAKKPEMLVLCHGPVEPNDSPLCVQDIQRLMPAASKSADRRRVLPADIKAADCDYHWRMRFDDPAKADPSVLAVCDNSFYVRMGDLRYHQVNVIRDPQTPSPWGIYTDSEDPLTGEKIAASINVWSHVNDLWSQGVVDMARFIKGELSASEVTDAAYVNDWALAAEAAAGNGALGVLDRSEVQKRVTAFSDGRDFRNGVAKDPPRGLGPQASEEVKAKVKELNNKIRQADIRADSSVMPVNRPYVDQRRAAAQGTRTEAMLIDDKMMQLAGMNRNEIKAAANEMSAGMSNGALWKSASILRGLNPQIQRDIRQAKENALAARGMCILQAPENVAPNSLTGMVDILERKFANVTWTHPERGEEPLGEFNSENKSDPWYRNKQSARAEAIRKFLAQRAQYAVMIHEMGHSIGERHNFVSSSNAWGYRPQYWQLRTKDGTVSTECADSDHNGEACVGPRYFDPVTEEERNGLIWMFMSSSVMDYAGENSQDLIGLGAYDFHAARFFYGDTMTVHADPSYRTNVSRSRGRSILSLTDTFGGIVGYQHIDTRGENIHYSQLNRVYDLLKPGSCQVVGTTDAEVREKFKPSYWRESEHGEWDPVMDGHIVKVNGRYTRCRGQEVDYVPYEQMRPPTSAELSTAGFYRGGNAVDRFNRARVPYDFATDSWADLGNLAVYRHDNGADAYELFNFFITEQETRHIFDNFRRNRVTFSVRSQSGRILWRYNEKMRDGAKGLGLLTNIYRDFAPEIGLDFNELWPFIANLSYTENILASGVAFDHFSRQLFRPQVGPHVRLEGDSVVRSQESLLGSCTPPTCVNSLTMPNGATGRFGQFSIGAKPVENALSDDKGEYDREYTMNAGSYYDKVYAPYLFTESVDNFISDSLGDFTDPRYRAVSMADLFPDGYRRLLANGLTGDDYIKGPRVAASSGVAQTDSNGFPALGVGWTSWWTPEPESCFPSDKGLVCSVYGCPPNTTCQINGQTGAVENTRPLDPRLPAETIVVDPQVGWEQQKWLIAMTLMYLPENQRTTWIDLMGIWEIGTDNDPEFQNRIELHLPDGRIYVARTYGTEEIFGKTVHRGVGARVLEYANELLAQTYYGTWFNNGSAEWFVPELDANGQPRIKPDSGLSDLFGQPFADCNVGADPNDEADDVSTGCTCERNRACQKLDRYKSLPAFMRQMMKDFRMAPASMKGLYD